MMQESAVFLAILKKYFIELKRYAFNTVMMMGGIYILFAMVFFGLEAFEATGETLGGTIVGFAMWIFVILGFSELAWSLLEEARNGTLEQLYLSPMSFGRISGYRIIASFLFNLLLIVTFMIFMMVGTGYYLSFSWGVIPLMFITILAVYGIGFMMGGLALVFKKVQGAFSILQFIFIFLLVLPSVTDHPIIYVVPISWGNLLLNRLLVGGSTIAELSKGSLAILLINSFAYLIAGYLVFNLLEKLAKDRGLLGHY
ncbi:MAG: hypothetical protein R6U17_09885 [Thermoplasmata archaeon]